MTRHGSVVLGTVVSKKSWSLGLDRRCDLFSFGNEQQLMILVALGPSCGRTVRK